MSYFSSPQITILAKDKTPKIQASLYKEPDTEEFLVGMWVWRESVDGIDEDEDINGTLFKLNKEEAKALREMLVNLAVNVQVMEEAQKDCDKRTDC